MKLLWPLFLAVSRNIYIFLEFFSANRIGGPYRNVLLSVCGLKQSSSKNTEADGDDFLPHYRFYKLVESSLNFKWKLQCYAQNACQIAEA